MAVKIRLKRIGKIRAPHYRVVVADSRTHRDGRVIEEIGRYIPTENPSFIEINSERAQYWLGVGAQPTEQVTVLLKLTGDWGTFKGEKGAKNTVQTKEAKVEFSVDTKKKPVLRPKTEKAAPVAEAPVANEAAEEAAEAASVEAVEEAVAEAVVEEVIAEAVVEAVEEAVAEAVADEVVEEAAAEVVAEAAEEAAEEKTAE